ncbi:putative integral membrane protein [Colletotrichum sublineola]|uniref:Putative integral membrane protein n=1 Tax=Colletotrichum sublineola TaxID=1173701 RepID=A0A066XSL0_COLSU|nr:putative integral membrane protein [Colletotrichum sublineola]
MEEAIESPSMAGWTFNTPADTPTTGPHIAALCIVFTSVALLLVCLRLYVRTILVKAVGYGLTGNTETKWGLGLTRLEDMPDENVVDFGRADSCFQLTTPFFLPLRSYPIGLYGFKMSLLLSYLRFFPAGRYQITTIIVAVACTMAHIAFFFVFWFQCTPKLTSGGSPPTLGSMFLPFPVIITSQIQRRKKAVLLGLFILGAFVTVIQAIRIQTIMSLSNYLDSQQSIRWSVVEACTGVIIACVPPLAPMVKYFAAKSRNASGGGGGGSGGIPRSSKPSSLYVLQTWGTKRSGMRPLSAGVDREASLTGTSATKAEDSTENILPRGITTKVTEPLITTYDTETWSNTNNSRQSV